MTTRRRLLFTLGAAALAGRPAWAQQDAATRSVVRQLEAQGFDVYSVRTTLLGRVRVLSRRGDLQREIVFDPRNGSILRDYTVDDGGAPTVGPEPGRAEGPDRNEGDRGRGPEGRDDGDDDGGGSGGGSDGGGGSGGGGSGGGSDGGGGSGGGGSSGSDDDDDDGGGSDDDDDDDGDDEDD
jgi:hypothetical protein